MSTEEDTSRMGNGAFIRFKELLAPPSFEDKCKTQAAKLLNMILLFLSAVSVGVLIWIMIRYGVPNGSDDFQRRFLFSAILLLAGITIGLSFLLRRGHVVFAGIGISVTLWVIITHWIYSVGVMEDSMVIGYLLVVIIAGLIINERAVFTFTIASMLAVIGAYYGQVNGYISEPITNSDPFGLISFIFILGIASFLLSFSVHSTNQAFKQAWNNENALNESNSRLIAKTNELKHRERALIENEEKYRALFENSPEGIAIIDLEGKIMDVNKMVEEITGLRRQKLIGSSAMEFSLFNESESSDFIELLSNAYVNGGLDNIELPIRVGNDTKWVEVFPAILKKDNEIYALQTIIRDITEQKNTQEAISQKTKELILSNAELEQFANVASHDLQEPLRMVASYLQLLERRYKGRLDSEADDYIGYAVKGATRMKQLIDDLLTYSSTDTQSKPFKAVDSGAILELVVGNLQGAIEESGGKVTHEHLPIVKADGPQLAQVLQNLISNGLKFRSDQPPHIHVSVEEEDNEWIFLARDNGIGIDPKYYERVFKVFQRLHGRNQYSGTGIGLAICKKIVERHGGRIWVESKPEKGSTFYFTIPKRGDNEP